MLDEEVILIALIIRWKIPPIGVSQPGAGIDIEYELSNNPNSNGYFINTSFRYNKNHGLICDAGSAGVAHISKNYTFEQCTFIGSENGDAAWPNSRNFMFDFDCHFVGKVWNPFPVIAVDEFDPIWRENTKFSNCTFDEEYDETDPSVPSEFFGRHYFSFTPEETEVIGGIRVPMSYCGLTGMNTRIGEHQAMVDFFNSSRVSMSNCSLKTNLTNKLLNLGLGASVMSVNYNELRDCYFESDGLNFIVTDQNDNCTCDRDIVRIRNACFYGLNQCVSMAPSRPDPLLWAPINPCGLVAWDYNSYTDWAFILGTGRWQPPAPPGFGGYWHENNMTGPPGALCSKFRDRVDPNTALPFYSSPCQDIAIGYPTQCSQSQRPVRLAKISSKSEIKVFPNPVLNDLYLNGLFIGSQYSISDLLGNVLIKNKVRESNEKINLAFLVPGVYFINIDGSSPQKIIKQ